MNLEDLGQALHIGLRKWCSGNAASIAWNIVNLMDDLDWLVYVKEAKEWLEARPPALALRRASETFDWTGEPYLTILHLAFELFTDNDWERFAISITELEAKNA